MENPVAARPTTPQNSKSFTRLESPRPSPLARSRAITLQNGKTSGYANPKKTTSPHDQSQNLHNDDIFEKGILTSEKEGSLNEMEQIESPSDVPEGFDELPIEIISLIDRFIESLAAKVHNTPPSIDKLSEIFQEFYLRAEASIATHIGSLATRQSRGASPNPSISSKSSTATRESAGAKPLSRKSTADSRNGASREQQMLTPQEISERRRARRLLDRKGTALEEAVERKVCERVYSRIWRHRSTLDEVRDEKLRSRTAALALVGIGLRDLGINFDTSGKGGTSQAAVEAEIEDWISKARDGLLRMNEAKYPLGKLQQLAAAHKSIVDLLTALHQSSSSADEILPTLIYTLITTPPEGINVISNLHFIQRFRAASKVDGEAAYCLVNLEAAITFLETVDLASLRADEALEGPPKSISRPLTPQDDSNPEWLTKPPTSAPRTTSSPAPSVVTSTTSSLANPLDSPLPSPGLAKHTGSSSPSDRRRLSNLLQPPANAFGAASDAVRNTADQGLKTIGHTLDSSFKLLFGRLQEHKMAGESVQGDGAIIVPKTLDDVRTLVQPKCEEDEEVIQDAASASRMTDDSLLNAIAGRKAASRDGSVDSIRSSGSAEKKKAAFVGGGEKPGTINSTKPAEPTNAGMAAVESMRSFGNSINPLRGFSGMTGLRGFGRSTSSDSTTPAVNTVQAGVAFPHGRPKPETPDSADGDSLPPVKVAPPIPRFMVAKNAAELKLGEVSDLLQDYKRLASALDQMGAL